MTTLFLGKYSSIQLLQFVRDGKTKYFISVFDPSTKKWICGWPNYNDGEHKVTAAQIIEFLESQPDTKKLEYATAYDDLPDDDQPFVEFKMNNGQLVKRALEYTGPVWNWGNDPTNGIGDGIHDEEDDVSTIMYEFSMNDCGTVSYFERTPGEQLWQLVMD